MQSEPCVNGDDIVFFDDRMAQHGVVGSLVGFPEAQPPMDRYITTGPDITYWRYNVRRRPDSGSAPTSGKSADARQARAAQKAESRSKARNGKV